MLASDSTQLSVFSGDVTEHPLYMTLANIPLAQRFIHANEAFVCCGMIPKMPKNISDADRQTEDFRLAKRRLMQDALQVALRPFMEIAKR
jgi:hypothetical protein